jgi:hypothetical protein
MRRLPALALLFAATYAAGVVLLLILFVWQYGLLGALHMHSAFIRSGFWCAALALLLLVRVWPRHWLLDAALFTLLTIGAAFAGEYAYMRFLLANGWIQESPLLAALISVEAPLAVLMPAAMAGRYLAAAARERTRALRVHELESRLAEARLELLRSQLQPHFLFNALNSVATLIRHDAAGAEAMLARLGRFYAIAAAIEGRQFVTLREEVGFVREYLAIEQIRFGARLRCEIEVDDAAADAAVPALILQPLAENAIKHGVARVPGPASVVVRARCDGARLILTVDDNGGAAAAAAAHSDGVGLANTRRRLAHAYGNDFALELQSAGGGTRLRVALPLRRMSEKAVA